MHDNIAAAMSELWDFAADTGTLTQGDDDPITCQIKIIEREFEEMGDMITRRAGKELLAKMRRAEIGVEPNPKTQRTAGDMLAVGSNVYEVIDISERDNHFVVCIVRDVT